MRENGGLRGRFAVRLAGWAAVAGMDVELDWPASGPYAAMMRRDWEAAADEFGELGWAYDRALMLSLLDGEHARESRRAHCSAARGPDAHHRGPHQRGDRRATGRLTADRRAPRGRGADEAGRHDAARGRQASI